MLAVGESIDRYEVESHVGSGGTALVYRVRHKQLGTRHALKILSVTSPAIRERLMLEGQVQATVRHLNIVPVTDVIEVNGNPGLILEYIEGPTLEEALRQYTLSVADAELLFLGILSGVRAAHRAGLVHRDLKPANILLAMTEAGFVPKVMDFGLAKVLATEGGSGTTRSGTAMGTPHYMAPEQIRDAQHVDQRADVFSLGCILYELVTGRRAFPGDEALAVYNRVVAGDYIDPDDACVGIPERVVAAIRGALLTDPEQRIPDAETLLAVLRGKRAWHAERRPVPADHQVTEEIPRGGLADGPSMALAERGPEGATPPPIPERYRSPVSTRSLETLPQFDVIPRERNVGKAAVVIVGVLALAIGGVAIVARQANLEREAPAIDITPTRPAPAMVQPKVEKPQEKPGRREASPLREGTVTPPSPTNSASSSPEAPPAEVAPAVIERATVKLLSDPPTASVRIDGQEQTPTPLKLDLAVGRHLIEMNSGGRVGAFAIDVGSGTENKWCFAFSEGQVISGGCTR